MLLQRDQFHSPTVVPAAVPPQLIRSTEDLDDLIERTLAAQKEYADFSQEQVDKIFRSAAMAANAARLSLAKQAVAETGMGVIEDKVIKNHFAAEFIYNRFKHTKTCGVIEWDEVFGIRKIAEPLGILAGIIPTTNPTSTTIFKGLLALKTRNAIVFSPHPRAKACTVEAARILMQAAWEAGAPDGIIGWIDEPTVELSRHLMMHPDIAMTLATGGPGMVQAAYSSGKPAIGVGAGNTPAIIDETSDIRVAVNSILLSKTFDHGMICASEQSVVVVDAVYEAVRSEFVCRGAHLCNPEQAAMLRETMFGSGKLNAAIVGRPASQIAELAGFTVSDSTKVLVVEIDEIGPGEPLSCEKLSPVLSMYRATDFTAAMNKAQKLLGYGGMGHTAVLYTDPTNRQRIERFSEYVSTARVLINQPSSQGAIGDIYNFRLEPSLTLGCGSWGGNSVSENVGVKHLLNIKTVSERRENMLWFRIPPKVYFKKGCLPTALAELEGCKRAFVVTDAPLFALGITQRVTDALDELDIDSEVFFDVQPDPDIETVHRGVARMQSFQPDVIVAVGGGSPMDAAKIMWLLYEHPDVEFEDLALRFMDIRKRVFSFPKLGDKAKFVAIPTTSGTGSEVTPFAVVTDQRTGRKYPIADYELTPNMAIVDPDLAMAMPKALTAHGGIDALVHALEALASVLATDFTNALALESSRILIKYLPAAYERGREGPREREKVHNAATMAGMAFANAFLGLCHSMAHKLGATFHLPHGLANALLICEVIRFNATDTPRKQAAFPQYEYPHAKARYARLARLLELSGDDDDELVESLIESLETLKRQLNIPGSIQAAGVPEDEFLAKLEEVSEEAFDDQCTGANPRYPLMSEIRQLLLNAYYGSAGTLPTEMTVCKAAV